MDEISRMQDDGVIVMYPIPDDLERWGWALSGGRSGPRKHPGAWYELTFFRERGLALGDQDAEREASDFRVRVRRSSIGRVWLDALAEMRERSRDLVPAPEYDRLIAVKRQRFRATRRLSELRLRLARGEDAEAVTEELRALLETHAEPGSIDRLMHQILDGFSQSSTT